MSIAREAQEYLAALDLLRSLGDDPFAPGNVVEASLHSVRWDADPNRMRAMVQWEVDNLYLLASEVMPSPDPFDWEIEGLFNHE